MIIKTALTRDAIRMANPESYSIIIGENIREYTLSEKAFNTFVDNGFFSMFYALTGITLETGQYLFLNEDTCKKLADGIAAMVDKSDAYYNIHLAAALAASKHTGMSIRV